MQYNYRCLLCDARRSRPWEDRDKAITCGACKGRTRAPTPNEQWDAWVDDREAPEEMEIVAYAIHRKGDNLCTVPWCEETADVLDHRVAFANGGHTSARNLFPMCNAHNQSKGDKVYEEWLAEVPQLAEKMRAAKKRMAP